MRTPINRLAAAFWPACVSLIILAFSACGGSSGLQKDPGYAIGSVTSATIHSAQTGAVYPIDIYLPASYSSGTATYPVIYATDGDARFPPDGRFVNFKKILQRRSIDAILVGIGGTKRRGRDFVLPGATAYHAFLTEELIPYVESHFRANPQRRILSGISLGGSFVVTSLFIEAPKTLFFSDYVSAEGSFFQHSFIVQERRLSSTIGNKSIPATLILARGAAGSAQETQFSSAGSQNMGATLTMAHAASARFTNSDEVNSLYRRMVNRHYVDLVLIETKFATDHVGTDNPSFEDAMVRIFK